MKQKERQLREIKIMRVDKSLHLCSTFIALCFLFETAVAAETTEDPVDSNLDLGGALRLQHRYEDWDSSSKGGAGKIDFESLTLKLKGNQGNFFADASYYLRYLNDEEINSLEHGYVGYRFSSDRQLQLGWAYEPFGLQPYPQFGWTFNIPFYLAMGHSSALGGKYVQEFGDWDIQLGAFKKAIPVENRFSPNMADAKDVDDAFVAPTNRLQANEKENQFNLHLNREFKGDGWDGTFGVSAYRGDLVNRLSDGDGDYWGAELQSIIHRGPWTLALQGIRYAFNPNNPAGVSEDSVLFAGAGTPSYLVAAKGSIGVANLAYDLPVSSLGPVKKLRLYSDYSHLLKDKAGWDDSQMATLGVQFFAWPVMGWLDFTWGRNLNVMGGRPGGVGLASADASGSDRVEFRTNLNIGYYF
ncbi:hypothetical protein [Microbulbifer sp. TYP-18]|uniref:hypothetical protein n=1 Tax=Microbulbifer sp. TYP-18 TaxID=3230024 RepID=UPI0034C68003